MEKLYGSLPTLPLKSQSTLKFRMPEVPLTKCCLDEYQNWQCSEPLKKQCMIESQYTDEALGTLNEHREAVKGLSLWYTNHLSAMYAIQQYKDYHNAKAMSLMKTVDKPFTFDTGNVFKLKPQRLVPHIDLENYLNSLKSRQKERPSFGKHSKVWEKYFEKAIPGWKIDSGLLKRKKGKKGKKKAQSSKKNYDKISLKSQAQPSSHNNLQNTEEEREPVPRLSKMIYSNNQEEHLANNTRDYFLNAVALKNEQAGNINNEIIFNQVYGKYLSRDKQNIFGKRRKRKPKFLNKKIISSDNLFVKNPTQGNNILDYEDKRKSLKQIDSLIIAKQTEIESLLLDINNTGNPYNKSRRSRSKTKNFTINSAINKKRRELTPSAQDNMAKITPKCSSSNKFPSRQFFKTPARMFTLTRNTPQKKRRAKGRLACSSNIDTTEKSSQTSPIPEEFRFDSNHQFEIKDDEKLIPTQTFDPKDKNDLRKHLIEMLNRVWQSETNQAGLKDLPAKRSPTVTQFQNSLSE